MKTASIFQQLALFTIGVAVAAMSLSFAVTIWIPPPEAGRMNVEEAAYALRGLPSSVVDLHDASSPPDGQRSDVTEDALAKSLGAPRDAVRAVWHDLPGSVSGPGQAVVQINGHDVLVEGQAGGFTMRSGNDATLRTSTLVPLFEAAVRLPDGNWRVGVPRDPLRQAWRTRIIMTYIVGVLLLTPLAWMVARRIAQPVVRLGLTAGVAAPTAVDPFPVEGPQELRRAAEAMNAMHGRLRDHSAEEARIFGALAHDIRTPLTALRLRAEALEEPLQVKFVADLRRMEQMAAELLERTKVAAARPVLAMVDLAVLLSEWCADWREAGEPVALEPSAALLIRTDAMLLRRAIDNLIDNAVRYGGGATVSIRRVDAHAQICVADPGPGIPEGRIEEVTRPFVRLEPSRKRERVKGGAGLGLSIVKDIVALLGGRLAFSLQPEGFSVSVRLPHQS